MKKNTFAILTGMAFSTSTFAAENINLENIIVTASRVAQPRENSIADITVIDAEEIQRAGQSTLVELLARQAGIEVSSNGGAGSLSNVYLRGTNANHVVVLIDGLRVNSATAGTTAFENLPMGQIDKIEILRGPASTLYGQDAIGGVIQIFTKRGDGTVKFNASVGYGSYNTKRIDAGVSGSTDNTHFALNLSNLDTKSFSTINTTNAKYSDKDAYRNLSFSGNISHQIEVGHEIGVQFLHSDGHGHYDSAPSNFDSNAYMKQYSYAIFSYNQFTDFWLSKIRIGEGVDASLDFSPYSLPNGSLLKTKQFQLSWQNDFKLPLGTLTLLYDNLDQLVKSNDTSFAVTARDNDGFTASYLLDTDVHSLQMSARHDSNSQFGEHNTGSIGYGYKLTPYWRLSTNYGTGFKAPTFNDLYWPFTDYGFGYSYGGNPNLKPEKSHNIEARIHYQSKNTNASILAFHNTIDNLISSNGLPAGMQININHASIKGISFSANHQLENFNVGVSVDIQSPKDEITNKLLARRANRHASANVSYTMGHWQFVSEAIASSIRYNNATNTEQLAGYALLNATVEYKFSKDWSIQARADNILDKKYSLALDYGGEAYNTPGTNLFINFRYQPD